MRASLIVAIFVAVCLGSSIVSAWGTTGHKTVAAIAEKLLDQSAATAVTTWLATEDSMVTVAIEPDVYRYGNGKWTSSFHYCNLPRSAKKFTMLEGCPGTCVITAIKNYTSILEKVTPTPDVVEDWRNVEPSPVSFLIHFMGDIHQPLHISYEDDKGGNAVKVSWFGVHTNLHSVWDDRIINHTGMFWPELSSQLLGMIKQDPSIISKYSQDMDPVSWAQESFAITLQVYSELPAEPIKFSQDYFDEYFPVVQQRLLAGGIRLAKLLNQIFSSSARKTRRYN
jgi:hypothetical protein